MTVADMKAAVALAVEQAMKLIVADDAPAVPKPAAKPKRKGNPEALRKWRESQKAGAVAEKPAKPRKAKKGKKAEKPAAESTSTDTVILRAAGVEVVAYDGGVVLRAPGRRRGIPFRKGDWALFAAFCNTLRSKHMDAITKAVATQIG